MTAQIIDVRYDENAPMTIALHPEDDTDDQLLRTRNIRISLFGEIYILSPKKITTMQNDHLEGTYKWPEEPYKPTQRDYFAAAALTGLLANSYTIEGLSRSILNKAEVIRSYTTACIEHADDIIKRLNETK